MDDVIEIQHIKISLLMFLLNGHFVLLLNKRLFLWNNVRLCVFALQICVVGFLVVSFYLNWGRGQLNLLFWVFSEDKFSFSWPLNAWMNVLDLHVFQSEFFSNHFNDLLGICIFRQLKLLKTGSFFIDDIYAMLRVDMVVLEFGQFGNVRVFVFLGSVFVELLFARRNVRNVVRDESHFRSFFAHLDDFIKSWTYLLKSIL